MCVRSGDLATWDLAVSVWVWVCMCMCACVCMFHKRTITIVGIIVSWVLSHFCAGQFFTLATMPLIQYRVFQEPSLIAIGGSRVSSLASPGFPTHRSRLRTCPCERVKALSRLDSSLFSVSEPWQSVALAGEALERCTR